jgi:3-oxoacyl-[acyl-carrier protein] reductase
VAKTVAARYVHVMSTSAQQTAGQFAGRIALVTGGGRGIGRGISQLLAKEGAVVAVNYAKDAESAAETVELIRATGGEAKAYGADVGDPEAISTMLATVTADYGAVDLLVNNAGVASRGRSVVDTAPDEAERLLRTHAIGPHHLCRLALPAMRDRVKEVGRGDVIMVSSVATDTHQGYGAPYNMGKAAMESLAFSLAKEEVVNGIHVNVVAPGLVVSDMGRRLAKAVAGVSDIHELDAKFPFGRVCEPEDVARVVVFLCSDAAGYVTGERIRVHGGGQNMR